MMAFLPLLSHGQDQLVQAMLNDVSIDSMIYHCSAISGEFPVVVGDTTVTISSRNKNNPGNALAAQYIKERLEQYGLSTTIDQFSASGENVIAVQQGALFPDQKVIVCGHYDSMPTGNDSPAADDDGSGTAAVMEAARVMSQYNYAYTIEYALWDEEEYGLVGANNYASAASNNGDSIIAVINIDAIAYDGNGDSLARVHVRDHANSINVGTVAENMISTYNIGLQIEVNNPGATYSDHAAFWNNGYTAILIIEDFDNDGNPHYHTPTDRVEHFDTTYYHQIAKWAFATAATMAIPLDANVGVEEAENSDLVLFPNPTTGVLNIEIGGETTPVQVEIIDLKGSVVYQENSVTLPCRLDVSAIPVGHYLIRIINREASIDISHPLIKN